MPAFPKPSATETDPVASPAVSAEATARAEADAAHAALTTSAHGGIVASAEKGAANGVATLDGSGRLPASQQTIGVFEYQGTWNASTNSPTLADGTGTKGFLYRVTTAGSRNLGSGSISFAVGDYVIHNGTTWEKADTTDAVSSVNGRQGDVTGLAEQSALTTEIARAQAAEQTAVDLAGTKALPTKAWVTATAYLAGQMVTNGGSTYTANDAHTSGATFAGDLGSHWTLLPMTASDVSAIASSALDTDGTLAANSDSRVASQKAVRTYVAANAPASARFFGDGSDGDVTITGTVTLTRDMQYRNLVVNGTLETAGCRVMIRGTLTGAGTIKSTPAAGGGAANNSGASFVFQLYYGSQGSGNQMQGAVGVVGVGASPANPHGFASSLGGLGGAGGAGTSGAGGAASALNALTVATSGVTSSDKLSPFNAMLGHGINGTGTTIAYNGGTGGGSGAGDGTNKGGGGGGGGGVVIVFAYDASGFTGTISAIGGDGGSPTTGNCGGGGGGGGGYAALFTGTLPTGSYTISAAGGNGGTKSGTGVNGSNGSAGTTVAAVI